MCFYPILFGRKFREPKRVLITGFGPYQHVPHNRSWEGVSSMDKNYIETKNQIILLKEEIAVRYLDVDLVVPALWRGFLPDLTIHVGVADTKTFRLETNARNTGYYIPDIEAKMPRSKEIVPGGRAKITTTLDVELICEEFNRKPPGPGLKASVSHDAESYLCEYIYYTSLCRGPALFVHIPPEMYSRDEVAQGIQRILELCLKHI
ncbi:pyroglutamyl-peptidase 1 [Helicoverpa armigera]|uniref:pyroglutamyl-peptidase 1 n=1 Tax=Helicoverpa armigera TaxID=29058 RepID=UPI0030836055